MKVNLCKENFVYRFVYEDDAGSGITIEFPIDNPVVEYIMQTILFVTTGRLVKWLANNLRLDYKDGILVVDVDGSPPTRIGLADDFNPMRVLFLQAVSALLELAELQQPVQ